MTQRFLRALLFDLGGTLMHARQPWPAVTSQADRALVLSLRSQGLDIADEFATEFRARLEDYYGQRSKTLFETTYRSVLGELLAEKNYPSLAESIPRSALDALFGVTHENWALEEDAVLTLKMLESAGYRMGIVSNAGDEKDVLELVERFEIGPYFDFVLTSATCSYRKPHPRIFEVALSHWGFPAREAVMIGDTLDADIAGGANAGLYTIWISRRMPAAPAETEQIKPDSHIQTLLELPALLNKLS
jgi:HAD superfamily hydrolase (TIGR01662 family)